MFRGLRKQWRRRRRSTCLMCTLFCLLLVSLMYQFVAWCVIIDSTTRDKGANSNADQQARRCHTESTDRNVPVETVLHELSGHRAVSSDDLENAVIQNTVHFVWCHNRSLEFRDYVGILSVWKILRPDTMEFHHQFPMSRDDKYNTWLQQLESSIPGFTLLPMPQHWDGQEHGCGPWFGVAVLDDRGGVYVGEGVAVRVTMAASLRRSNFSLGLYRTQTGGEAGDTVAMEIAWLAARHHDAGLRQFKQRYSRGEQASVSHAVVCQTIRTVGDLHNNITSPCLQVAADVHPADVFTLETMLGDYVRTLVYGSSRRRTAGAILPGLIPQIVHYVWFGSKEMSFIMYLSILSTLFILDPSKVYIHGDGGLHGEFLDLALKDKRVVLVYMEKPWYIFGHRILYSQHRSDIVRADVLVKYGGIYMDWDVLWLRGVDELINTGYDAIANFDHMPQLPFPDTINLGVLMAKPKSTFVKRWQDALRNYRSEDFLYNAIELPYKVYEQFPDTLHIERHLQVMCFHLKCHPTFHGDFKNHHQAQPFNWKTDSYAIHFTYPDPSEYASPQTLMNATGMFADIGRHIYKHASRLQ